MMRISRRSHPFFALIATVLIASASAVAQPTGVQKITSVEGITEYHLDNGLQVLLFPDASKPTATVNVTYLVGSRHEGAGETGMAHLLEHMVFKGSPHHGDIKKELADRGMRFNGSTGFDRTNYFETLQASDENLRWALSLEAERMTQSYIRKSDLDTEMTVVRNEFEMGENSPSTVLLKRMLGSAYEAHNYGRLPIGVRSDIEHVPIDRLQAFYRKYYQPDNAVLAVAGKFDEPKTLAMIAELFGPIPRPDRKLEQPYTEEPVQDGERSVVLRRVGDVQSVAVMYHVPSGSDPSYPALQVLMATLDETPSGRLYKALVDSRKASSVSGLDLESHDPGVLLFSAQVRKDASLDAARDAMLETVEGVIKEPPSKEEVDRARTRLLKQFELGMNDSQAVCLALSEAAATGDWRLIFLSRDRLKKVEPKDVVEVAKAYLKPSNRTLGMYIPTSNPDRAEIPPPPDVAAMVKDYKGAAAVSAGEVFDPSPANIDARTVHSALPSGLKLALLSKKTRGGTVFAVINLHFGDEKSLFDRSTAASMAAAMLMRGTQKHNRQQIQDELDKLKARMSVGGGATGFSVSIETTRENLPAVLRLAAEVLREPTFPESELELARQARLASIEAGKSEPQAIAQIEIQRYLSPYPRGDVRAIPTPDEQIEDVKKVTLADAKKFYQDFAGASNGEMAVVGDFDTPEIQTLAAELLGSWKSPAHYARVTRPWQPISPVNRTFETPDKQNAFFIAGLRMNVGDEDPDYAALAFADYMLGGGFQSRLVKRIREKDGLSYAVQSAMVFPPKEKNAIAIALAICAPKNILNVEAAYKDEIARLLKDGFTADEVNEARKGWLQQQQIGRSQDQGLVRRLATNEEYGRTMVRDTTIEQKVMSLTPEQLTDAVRRNLKPDQINYFKAGDFKKAGITH